MRSISASGDRDAGEALEVGASRAARRPARDGRRRRRSRRTLDRAAGELGDERRAAPRGVVAAVEIGAALEAVRGVGVQAEALRADARSAGGRSARASSSTSVVRAVTSVSSPPMMPARPTARARSAITRISGSSSRSLPSSVVSFSPARARRTTELAAGDRSRDRRRGAAGPISQRHEVGGVDDVVDRARADRLEPPHAASSGDGPIFTPRITRAVKRGQPSGSSISTESPRTVCGERLSVNGKTGGRSGVPRFTAISRARPR